MFYILQILIALVSPLILFLYAPLYNNPRRQIIALSAFLTATLMFFKPLDGFDLLVHFQNFTDYQAGYYTLFTRYFGVDLLIYAINMLGLGENTLVFITSFFLFFSTYKFVINRVPNEKVVLTFLLIVASYPIVLLISGVRYSLALSFFLLSDVCFEKNKKSKYIISSLIAIAFHYAASVLVVLYILSKFLRLNRLSTRVVVSIFLSIIPIIFFQSFLVEIVSMVLRAIGFEQYVGLDLSRYVSGEWGAMRSSAYNINGLVGYFIPKISLCLIGFMYLYVIHDKSSFVIILFGIVLLLFNFGDIGDRFAISLIPFFICALLSSMSRISVRKFPLPLVFIVGFCVINMAKEFWLYGPVYTGLLQSTFELKSPLLCFMGDK